MNDDKKQPLIPQIDEDDIELMAELLENGYILNQPKGDVCEVTLPMCAFVSYEVPRKMYITFAALLRLENIDPIPLRRVYLEEPGMGVQWGIVHTNNAAALRWEVPAEKITKDAIAAATLSSRPKVEGEEDEEGGW